MEFFSQNANVRRRVVEDTISVTQETEVCQWRTLVFTIFNPNSILKSTIKVLITYVVLVKRPQRPKS